MHTLRKLVSCSILISLGALFGVAEPIAAQDTVEFEIEAPLGHPGLKVSTFTLYQGGLVGTPVATWSGLLFVGGAPASISLPVTAVPDAYSAIYEIPFGGEATDVLIDTADLAFGTQYLIPNPSKTATPVTTAQPDSGGDAFIQLTLLPPPPFPDDHDAPTCDVTRNGLDIEATLQDVDSGLASIEVDIEVNLTASVPTFTVGTTDPVVVTALVDDPSRLTTLLLDVRDRAGNRIFCKSVTKHDGTSPGDVEVEITLVSAGGGFTSVPSLSGGAVVVLAAGLAVIALRRLHRR
jgi:hypothetical protein